MTQVVVPLSHPDPQRLLADAAAARAAGADLVELRLDLALAAGGRADDLIALIPRLGRCIVTIRHACERGAWNGDEGERIALYQRADVAGAMWLDRELVRHAERAYTPDRALLILSYHDFDGPGHDPAGKIAAMRHYGCSLAKVAVTARDAADLAGVKALIDGQGPVAAMAMGEHGFASRLLAGVWGSELVFARLPGDGGSAPGQPAIDDLLGRYRLRAQSSRTQVYGVIGSPIAHSLSPLVHNLALAHHGLDAVYVPFRVEDATAFWDACGAWIQGLSITIPHKESLQGRMDDLEPLCDLVGAMNTIYRKDGGLVGANTDADAIRRCGERGVGGSLAGKRVLVLGAGGAGRAACYALKAAGAQVTLTNRTQARAAAVATEVGCATIPWADAPAQTADLLVNMTSVGMQAPGDTPWPHVLSPGCGVFDSVYTPMQTRLLREAATAGCRTVFGLDMFIDQACAQFRRWTGRDAPAEAMRAAAMHAIVTK